MRTQLWAMALVFIAGVVGSFGPLFFKKGAENFRFNIKALIKNYNLIIGVALYGIATVIFIPALKGGELSVLYPFVATTYIWVSLLSMKFLKEKMGLFKWMGVILIIIGVIFIGLGS
ncbi:EamA family transporter [Candidatus Woesearchaeota archaeon]|nr:EamA family transporter [Candidatus Woesearchaeota archaeon]